MRHIARSACFLILLLLCALACAQTVITTSTPVTNISTLVKGAYTVQTLAPGPNTVTIDIDQNGGTYAGQFGLYVNYNQVTGTLRPWPGANISNSLSSGSTGITANATGSWTTTIPGPGYVYLACTSLTSNSSNQPTVVLFAGQGGLGGSSSTSAISNVLSGFSNLPWLAASWSSATSSGTALSENVSNMQTAIVTVKTPSTLTGGVVAFEAYDGTNWVLIQGSTDGTTSSSIVQQVNSPYTLQANTTLALRFNISAYQSFQIVITSAITGSGTTSVLLSANAASIADRTIVNNPQGSHHVNPPSSFATGTNWTAATGLRGIWIPLASGQTCTVILTDSFGTSSVYQYVNGSTFYIPISGSITVLASGNTATINGTVYTSSIPSVITGWY